MTHTVPPTGLSPPEQAALQDLIAMQRERTSVRLAALGRALERLRHGTYGACERCGQRMAFERLMARPTARTCVSCLPVTER